MTFDEILEKIFSIRQQYLNETYFPVKKHLRACIAELLNIIVDGFKEDCDLEDLSHD